MTRILIFSWIILPFCCLAQFDDYDRLYQETGLQYATLQLEDQSVEYLISESKPDQKGIIFYAQGSLPVPLIMYLDDKFYSTTPIRYSNFEEEYRLVLISKPGIPVVADSTHLDQRNRYINDEGEVPLSYTRQNYLSFYTDRFNRVIDGVLASMDKEYDNVVIIGHSQGARVVAKTASVNKNVTHVAYLSGNPLGRIDESVRREREAVLTGAKSEEDAHEAIKSIYNKWKSVYADKFSLDTSEGDSNYTWSSFSENTVDDLLNIDIPLFVGYGTRDITARYCDLLPLDFISHQKTNLTHRPYLGYDHSFYKVGLDGKVDFDTGIFTEVINDVLTWVADNPKG